ncbi:MAG: hypothetical protein K2X87_05695 [Gemmataceae bacterium]|nr:hypothetical protein [Gemmataceae bacterium]
MPGPNLPNPSWDVDAAVEHLRANAESGSVKKCAIDTRQAIEAGGVTLARHNSAKDYGGSLTAVGFVALGPATPAAGYAKGDVAVIDGFAGHAHGHLQMYDGTRWISDFEQNGFWPGSAYAKNQPAFVVYRHRELMPAPPSASSACGWTSTANYSSAACK